MKPPPESIPERAPERASREEVQVEVDNNYDFFKENLKKLMKKHEGEFALLRNQEIVGYFKTSPDAFFWAKDEFPDGLWSIQEVTDRIVDLGIQSYAIL